MLHCSFLLLFLVLLYGKHHFVASLCLSHGSDSDSNSEPFALYQIYTYDLSGCTWFNFATFALSNACTAHACCLRFRIPKHAFASSRPRRLRFSFWHASVTLWSGSQRQACLWLYQPTHCTAICLRATFNTWSAASLAFTIALSIVSFMDLLSIVSPDRTSDHVEYSPVHTPVQSGTTYDRHSTINSCTNSYVVLIGYNNQRNLHSSQRVCLVNGFTSELLSLSSPASVLQDRVLTHELSAMLNACDCSKPFSFALAPEAHFNATLSISQPWNCWYSIL